jgi:hypothetical protein
MAAHSWYFAYGANMAMSVFVDQRKMAPRSSEAARLEGFRLEFTAPGIALIEPVFANLTRDPHGVVHGVLHDLSHHDLELLDRDESTDYRHLEVEVVGERSGRVSAIAYCSQRRRHGRKPSRRYLALLQRGAAEFELPATYQRELAALPTHHLPLLSPVATQLLRVALPVRRWLRKR